MNKIPWQKLVNVKTIIAAFVVVETLLLSNFSKKNAALKVGGASVRRGAGSGDGDG